MNNETIQKLVHLWELLEEERRHIKFPNWWKRRKKPSKRELPRLSIRSWDNPPDWYRMMNIYWMISSLMLHLPRTKTFLNLHVNRDDVVIAAWKLGDYIKLARDAELRFFIERLQQLAYAIVASIDEDEF